MKIRRKTETRGDVLERSNEHLRKAREPSHRMSTRFSIVSTSPQRLTDEAGAGFYVKVPALFDKMKRHGWIKPIVSKRKIKLYDLNHLDRCVDRLAAGEFPGE